ncbi:unnamed protein product, partial [Nesidiocoris tenuis]
MFYLLLPRSLPVESKHGHAVSGASLKRNLLLLQEDNVDCWDLSYKSICPNLPRIIARTPIPRNLRTPPCH